MARARPALQVLQRRRRELERRVEQRYPALYDARHVAGAVGRALWPLIGGVLAALILLPVIALGFGLVALFDIEAPSVDLPELPLPDVDVPDWLKTIGDVIGDIARPVFVALLILLGAYETQRARRRRLEAARLGRRELVHRLAAALARVETLARERHAERLGDVANEELDHVGSR